jgi:hypothetical protein
MNEMMDGWMDGWMNEWMDGTVVHTETESTGAERSDALVSPTSFRRSMSLR